MLIANLRMEEPSGKAAIVGRIDRTGFAARH
jgi:hypothetical protein